MMKKIVLGIAGIAVVGLTGFAATQAYFSNTQTSKANSFTAGTLSMQIAETNSTPGNSVGNTTFADWHTNKTLFSYSNLIPGDTGTADWALKPTQNAWACIKPTVTGNSKDVSSHIEVAYWNDKTPNGEYNPGAGEKINSFELANNQYYPLEDTSGKVGSTGVSSDGSYRVGYDYCFGSFKRHSNGSLYIKNNEPVCNGASVTNAQQGGHATGKFAFYAEQKANNASFTCSSLNNTTTVVTQSDLATSKASAGNKWFFYQDGSSEGIDNNLGLFVTGPGNPPAGTGSAQISNPSGIHDRPNLATYQFGGVALADITNLSFSLYDQPDNGFASYLGFNVDFSGSDTWQHRLIYVPENNGYDANSGSGQWKTYNAANSNAVWEWSGYAINSNEWPTQGFDSSSSFDRSVKSHTWSEIKAAYPSASTLAGDPFMGIRVDKDQTNIDKFVFGANGVTKTFDFGN
jgi:predicted ribosomally synthesized peptide with SipW-like signal peptide